MTAATLDAQTVHSVGEYLAEPRWRDASAALGEHVLMQCEACHTVDADAGTLIGPALYGVIDRRAGSLPDFDYSDAFADVDFVWTPRVLDAWIADPAHFLPGTRMTFPGLPNAEDRTAVIAALLRRSAVDRP